jgi:hypothetical protein
MQSLKPATIQDLVKLQLHHAAAVIVEGHGVSARNPDGDALRLTVVNGCRHLDGISKMIQSCQYAVNTGLVLSVGWLWLKKPETSSAQEYVVDIFRKRLLDHITQLSPETQQGLRTISYYSSEGRTALLNPTLVSGCARYGCVLNPAAMRRIVYAPLGRNSWPDWPLQGSIWCADLQRRFPP